MAYHFIAIASYYSGGRRIGWHYSSNEILNKEVISDFLESSQKKLGKVEFGIHKLTTDNTSWSSIIEKDSYFEDVMIIKDKNKFLEMLDEDKQISVFDIAKFFLSVGSVTNLKLQKLIYLSYATHLNRTGDRLFTEPIVAYKYGPVIEDVYTMYKQFGKESISEDKEPELQLRHMSLPLSLAKITLNDSSKEIMETLNQTIKKYWHKSVSELVTLTHVTDGPWDRVYKEQPFCGVITDDLIRQYHYLEVV